MSPKSVSSGVGASDLPHGRHQLMTTRINFLSTYPPTLCGLASFTASLFDQLGAHADVTGQVIRVLDTAEPATGPEVIGALVADEPSTVARSVEQLNSGDVSIVQHEYGVYGGPDGDQVLAVLEGLVVPSIVVLHTVLSAPTPHQKAVLERVAALAGSVVTMTAAARARLAAGYEVDQAKVVTIPHGAPATTPSYAPSFRSPNPSILTWGLLGPGKGIEWAITAMAALQDLSPSPHYVVAGQTHPKVLAHEGERYRSSLQDQVRALGLATTVTLDGYYRQAGALAELVASADVVLLPYDSTEQVTSGVLIEAVAALKPVVATRFPHAVELLGDGAGILVPHRDPDAIAAALRTLLTHRKVAAGMTRAAAATVPGVLWPAVAGRYLELAEELVAARVAA
jgi:polysaccharide biosynthesis protein PslF